MKVKKPNGWHNVTPRIFASDTEKLVSFLKDVFQAQGNYLSGRPTELLIGDSIIMVSDAEMRGEFSACFYVYVLELEETFQRAVDAGAKEIEAPTDTPYGDRRAVIKDPWGNMWQIAEYGPR